MGFDEFPYAGVASFLKSPLIAAPTRADGDVAVLGVPFDQGTTSRSGTRSGPRAIRDASTMYAYFPPGERVLDGETGDWILDGVRFVDAGDADVPPMAPVSLYHERVAGRVRELAAAGLFVVGLGGDHSVTYPLLKGLARRAAARRSTSCSSTPTWTTGATRAGSSTRTPAR